MLFHLYTPRGCSSQPAAKEGRPNKEKHIVHLSHPGDVFISASPGGQAKKSGVSSQQASAASLPDPPNHQDEPQKSRLNYHMSPRKAASITT